MTTLIRERIKEGIGPGLATRRLRRAEKDPHTERAAELIQRRQRRPASRACP